LARVNAADLLRLQAHQGQRAACGIGEGEDLIAGDFQLKCLGPIAFIGEIKPAAEHGGEYTWEMRAKLMGSNNEEWSRFIKETLRLGDDWPLERVTKTIYERGVELYATRLQLMPGFIGLITRIRAKGLKTGLASGSTIEVITEVFDRFDLYQYFDVMLSSDSVEHSKPAPDVFLEVARQLHVQPEDCTGIEDSPNGVASILAAGMKCIAVPDAWVHEHPTFQKAHIIRQTLAEVTLEDAIA
jgi:HAD superfamily hydrolase (TIGR01509 family)